MLVLNVVWSLISDLQICKLRSSTPKSGISRSKNFSRFRRILRYLSFCRARSKFGVDSPFYSGDIAAFVPVGRTLENRETAIFIRTLRAVKYFRIRAPLHVDR